MMMIKNWEIFEFFGAERVHGEVYGNPKFPDGSSISTSTIKDIMCFGDKLIVNTVKSGYVLLFSDKKEE